MRSRIVEGATVSGTMSHHLLSSPWVELPHDACRSVGPDPCFRESLQFNPILPHEQPLPVLGLPLSHVTHPILPWCGRMRY